MTDEPTTGYSEMHGHEPTIPQALDAEGRCLVCVILTERNEAQNALALARQENQQVHAALEQSETERDAWKRWTYEAEARLGSSSNEGRGLTAKDLEAILLAKTEVQGIATGFANPELVAEYQLTARNAHRLLGEVIERLSVPETT